MRKRKTGRVCAHDGRGGGAAEEWVDVKRVESVAGLWIVPVTTIILWAVVVVVVPLLLLLLLVLVLVHIVEVVISSRST